MITVAAATLCVVVAVALTACGSSGGSASSGGEDASAAAPAPTKGAPLTVWIGGNYFAATPGTPQQEWLDYLQQEYEAKNPGSKVTYVLAPAEYGAFQAKLSAAFSSGSVPDLMLLYTGGWLTSFIEGGVLQDLTGYVSHTKGLYDSLERWENSCEGFDCKNGKGPIYGVPQDQYGRTYGLFYNKALFKEAGITSPPKTYAEVEEACGKLNAKGITPISLGNKEGIGPVEWVENDYASYIDEEEAKGLTDQTVKWTDPKLVAPLEEFVKLKEANCFNRDADTREWLDSHSIFLSGQAAMTVENPAFTSEFEEALGNDLAVAPVPQSGPDNGATLVGGVDNWVIPAKAANKGGAWEFVKIASSEAAQDELVKLTGNIPTNKASIAKISNPNSKFFVAKPANAKTVPIMDLILKVKEILLLYKGLQEATAGRTSAEQAMSNLESNLATLGAPGA